MIKAGFILSMIYRILNLQFLQFSYGLLVLKNRAKTIKATLAKLRRRFHP